MVSSYTYKVLTTTSLFRYSQVDLQTQEAYELAVRGLLRPMDKSPPILTGLKIIRFNPPHFTLGKNITGLTQNKLG